MTSTVHAILFPAVCNLRVGLLIVRVWVFVGLVPAGYGASLTLHPDRLHPLDLAISGELVGLEPGKTAYLRARDLQSLPTQLLTVENYYQTGKQTAKVVLLSDLWAALPLAPGADTLLAHCEDGYASVFPLTFIEQHRPFVILEFEGKTLEAWAELGFSFNAGPYIISVSEVLSPGVRAVLDIGHKEPWAVNRLSVIAYRARFASLYSTKTSPAIDQGRQIWVNSCFSCHLGPDRETGGNKSGIPFGVVQSYAHHNTSYLKQYIRDPKKLVPAARMEPHPHYTDDQLNALIAFLRSLPR